ncbi:MAG: histidinol-phosphate transaminase [Anaerolineae bacterium]
MGSPRLNPNLLTVPLYIAGRSVEDVKQELGLDEVIKLASNESPVGPSPMAVAAARAMLDQAHRYPGITDQDLRSKLAGRLDAGFDAHNLITGNGGTDVLRMMTQAFVFDGGNTVMSRVTFPMYRILTGAFGGAVRLVAAAPDYRHDLAAMAAAIDDDTRLVFLCSPNNPTGQIITQAEADTFMARVPGHVVVVFDEAYYDYVTDSDYADSRAYIKEGRNVLILRSFSKTAGLANMRVGYAIGPAELVKYMRHAQLPFHTGAIALSAAYASLDDETYHQRHKETVLNGRKFLADALSRMGLHCLSGQANFVLIANLPMATDALVNGLLHRGFIVRGMAAFGLPDAIRVTVGSPAENEQFVAAMQAVLALP